jgi:hypothetical protein
MTRSDLLTASLTFTISIAGGDWSIRAYDALYLIVQGPGQSRSYGDALLADLANGRAIDRTNPLSWTVDGDGQVPD